MIEVHPLLLIALLGTITGIACLIFYWVGHGNGYDAGWSTGWKHRREVMASTLRREAEARLYQMVKSGEIESYKISPTEDGCVVDMMVKPPRPIEKRIVLSGTYKDAVDAYLREFKKDD